MKSVFFVAVRQPLLRSFENHHDHLQKAGAPPSMEEFNAAWEASFKEWVYFPSRSAYGRITTATKADRLESARHQFEVWYHDMWSTLRNGKWFSAVVLSCGSQLWFSVAISIDGLLSM